MAFHRAAAQLIGEIGVYVLPHCGAVAAIYQRGDLASTGFSRILCRGDYRKNKNESTGKDGPHFLNS
jgi:hypothetical protein